MLNQYFKSKELRNLQYIAIISSLLSIFLLIYGSAGPRGTDQYWYLADVDALIQRHRAVTNFIYPTILYYKPDVSSIPFIHNLPIQYLVAIPAFFFGSYGGWIFANAIAAFLAAGLTGYAVSKVTSPQWGLTAFVLFLLCPLTYWHITNPLSEMIISLFVAVSLAIYVTIDRHSSYMKWITLTFFVIIAYYSRSSLILLLPWAPLVYLLENRPLRHPQYGFLFLLIFMIAGSVAMKDHALKPYADLSLSNVLTVDIPGKPTDQDPYCRITPEPITFHDFKLKATDHIKRQFIPTNYQDLLFYLPIDFCMLFTLIGIRKRMRYDPTSRIILFGVLMILIHLISVVVFQQQPRYGLVMYPVILSSGLINIANMKRISPLALQRFLFVATFILLMVNFRLARYLRSDSEKDAILLSALKTDIASVIPEKDSYIVEGNYTQLIGYDLQPRMMLTLHPAYTYSQEIYKRLESKIKAKWLIAMPDAPIVKALNGQRLRGTPVTKPYGTIFRIAYSDNPRPKI